MRGPVGTGSYIVDELVDLHWVYDTNIRKRNRNQECKLKIGCDIQ